MGSEVSHKASEARKHDAICRARAHDSQYLFAPIPRKIVIDPTVPQTVAEAKKLLMIAHAKLELINDLEESITSWIEYNNSVKDFIQNGFKDGLSPDIKNLKVLNSSQMIGDANMHNVFRALKYSLTGNNGTISETYDAAERAKDKIANDGMAITQHIVQVSDNNMKNAFNALIQLRTKRQDIKGLINDLEANLRFV